MIPHKAARFRHRLAGRLIPAFLPAVFLFLVLYPNARAFDPKSMKLAWDFKSNHDLYYSIKQTSRMQSGKYDFNSQKWQYSPSHSETVEGNCAIIAQGDGNAMAMVILSLQEIKDGGQPRNQPEEQYLPQLVAKFMIKPDGTIFNYEGGSARETYLILRLMFLLPEEGLRENHGRIFPLKLLSSAEPDTGTLKGSISQLLTGFEERSGNQFANYQYTIDLSEDPPVMDAQGPWIWKGKGDMQFNLDRLYLNRANWEIARKLEITSSKSQAPSTLTEIFNISFAYDPNQTTKQVFDQLFMAHKEISKYK